MQIIVIASIHQPSASTFDLFDQAYLLSKGRQCYGGPKASILPYFESIGYPIPNHMSVAEFLLDLVNTDFSMRTKESPQRLARITDEIRVLHKWQRGDVLVFDNIIAQHGRQPWGGEQSDRVVLASLFDGEVPGAYTDHDWAQVVPALEG